MQWREKMDGLSRESRLFYILHDSPYRYLWRKVGKIGLRLGIVGMSSLLGHALNLTPVKERRYRIPVPGLDPSFHGFRIAHLSDFHFGYPTSERVVAQAIALVNGWNPDLVVLTGDYFERCSCKKRLLDYLGNLRSRHGVLAVPGNHEYGITTFRGDQEDESVVEYCQEAFCRLGFRFLRNESWTLRRGQAGLHFVGLDELWTWKSDPALAYREIPPGEPTVLLAHNPDSLIMLGDYPAHLVLSGHTHGGQLSLGGRPLHIPLFQKEYSGGLFRLPGGWLCVHRGVGCATEQLRWGVPPEAVLLELQAAQGGGDGG